MKLLIIVILMWPASILAKSFDGSYKYEAQIIFKNLRRPWGITLGPDKNLYVTEKSGKIIIIKDGKKLGELSGIPSTISSSGQGGLMDIVFHPQFEKNNYVYLAYSTRENAVPANGINTRISRMVLDNNKLSDEKILVQGAYGTDGAHFGCRLAFDDKGYLFAAIGERHNKEKAQDLKFLNGKVIRIHDDGQIPSDNPFFNVNEARKEIFSFGHRNPQGLDIHPLTNTPVVSEHGPSGYDAFLPKKGRIGKADEVNWIEAGGNYGWPILFGDPAILPWTDAMKQFLIDEKAKMPVKEFTVPDGIAPGGAVFYRGQKFPNWKNDLFVAALRGYIIRLKISNNGTLVEDEKIIPSGFSRIRDVENGPNGNLYFITDRGEIGQIEPL